MDRWRCVKLRARAWHTQAPDCVQVRPLPTFSSPFCLLTPSPKSTEGRSRGAPLDEAKEQRRKGRPEFLLPWKRILIQFLSSPVSSPSSLSSFGLQLSKTRLPALTLLSRRKTPQLQTQVKQIFVAASKFQRLFIVRLSAPGAKSCC